MIVAGDNSKNVGPATNAGAAYLFAVDADSGTLELTCNFTRTDSNADHRFGTSVGITGPWVVVGTPSFSGEYNFQGVVDLYQVIPAFVVCRWLEWRGIAVDSLAGVGLLVATLWSDGLVLPAFSSFLVIRVCVIPL